MSTAPTSPEQTMKSRLTRIHRPDPVPPGRAPKSLAFAMAVLLLPLPVVAQSLCRLLDTVETESRHWPLSWRLFSTSRTTATPPDSSTKPSCALLA